MGICVSPEDRFWPTGSGKTNRGEILITLLLCPLARGIVSSLGEKKEPQQMAMHARRSEKDREKDKRFKDNVAQLLKRYEQEVQEARNRSESTAVARTKPLDPEPVVSPAAL